MADTTLSPTVRPSALVDVQPSRWQQWAACRKVPTTVFFPAGNYNRVAEEQAKTVCSSCPVRIPCLTFAIEHGEPFGVWGGLTAEERLVVARAVRKEGEVPWRVDGVGERRSVGES